MLADELYSMMLEVSQSAQEENVTGPLSGIMATVAHKCLPYWQAHPALIQDFAVNILKGFSDLRCASDKLPSKTRQTCCRLITFLEYIAYRHGQ